MEVEVALLVESGNSSGSGTTVSGNGSEACFMWCFRCDAQVSVHQRNEHRCRCVRMRRIHLAICERRRGKWCARFSWAMIKIELINLRSILCVMPKEAYGFVVASEATERMCMALRPWKASAKWMFAQWKSAWWMSMNDLLAQFVWEISKENAVWCRRNFEYLIADS